MNVGNVWMCRICEKDLGAQAMLTAHMRQNHCACEMPYICQLCNFRSSMYSDVVDHFKKVGRECWSMSWLGFRVLSRKSVEHHEDVIV